MMENGDNTETGLSDSYLAQSYAMMEGKYQCYCPEGE